VDRRDRSSAGRLPITRQAIAKHLALPAASMLADTRDADRPPELIEREN
jgi:hypothetical protein